MIQLLKIAFRNIIRNKRRTISIFLAIIVAVLVIEFVNGFIAGFQRMGYEALNSIGHIRLVRNGYEDKVDLLPLDLAIENYKMVSEQLLTIKGIKNVNSYLKFGAVLSGPDKSMNVMALGMDPSNTISRYEKALVKGKFIETKKDIFISETAATALGAGIGDSLIALTQDSYNSITAAEIRVCGFFKTLTKHDENVMLMHLEAVQDLLRMQGKATEMLLFVDNPRNTKAIIEDIKGIVEKNNLKASDWKSYNVILAVALELMDQFMLILVLIILIVGGTGIINTFLTSLFERIKEIGTMRAIGMKKAKIALLFIIEATLLGFMSSVLGCGLGSLLVIYFSKNGIFMGGGANMPGIGTYFYTQLTLEGLLVSLIAGTLISVFAIIYPLYLAMKVKPIEAITFSE